MRSRRAILKTPPARRSPTTVRPLSLLRNERRLRKAIATAKHLKQAMRGTNSAELAESLILQGILSGDVYAASIHTRSRLQNENLRLKKRLTNSRLKTERVKRELLEAAKPRPHLTAEQDRYRNVQMMNRINEIYGLDPIPEQDFDQQEQEIGERMARADALTEPQLLQEKNP